MYRRTRGPDDVHEVDVRVVGRERVITPAGGWDEWFVHGLRTDDDFLNGRDQGTAEDRESL
ncbi:hypothetical protein IF650_00010 [Cellulosimicrobium terreum]|nr:hypothetical protein [Cellulosimicrobium terreum]